MCGRTPQSEKGAELVGPRSEVYVLSYVVRCMPLTSLEWVRLFKEEQNCLLAETSKFVLR